MEGRKLADIFLFPKALYKKITDHRITLYLGFLLIGLVDMSFPIGLKFNDIFTGKPAGSLYFNIALAVLSVIVIGTMDVLFFAFPLFDLFKFFKKDLSKLGTDKLVIKVMKVYIMAHFLITPVNVLVYFATRGVTEASPGIVLSFLTLYSYVLIPMWFSAAITRGISVVLGIKPIFQRLAFMAILLWNLVLGFFAMDFLITNVIMRLFR